MQKITITTFMFGCASFMAFPKGNRQKVKQKLRPKLK
jgi:hypothetical protein